MKTVNRLRRLTPIDRCDRCSAEATIAIMFAPGELAFCETHYLEHGESLLFSPGVITGLAEFVDDGRPE